ncbi:MAG: anti-sigma factor family protein [Mycobacterium leprae]
MECNEARRLLDAYLDQALSTEQAEALEAHLNECDACWQEMTAQQGLLADLQDPELQRMMLNEPSPLPGDFTAQVMERVEAERPTGLNLVWPWLKRRWSSRQYTSVAYAVGATMVVVSASNLLFLWNQTTDRLGVWSAQGMAYWEGFQAQLGGAAAYLASFWHAITIFLHLA